MPALPASCRFRPDTCLALLAIVVGACGPADPGGAVGPDFAARGKPPTVASASPSTGRQGEAGLIVVITGSGYAPGARATWERNGAPDPKVVVQSTAYVSSTELRATISIAPDAEIAFYDVAVAVSDKKGIGTEAFTVTSSTVDPSATWKLSLDPALRVQSDGLFSDGAYSAYADGVCGMTGKIFATTQNSNTGDATLQTSKGGCTRTFRLVYPDGGSESVQIFANVALLQSTSQAIPLDATVRRHLAIGTSATKNSRCGRLLFGVGKLGAGVGSDSVQVTRTGPSAWLVESVPGSALALCEKRNVLYSMPIRFVIESSRELPVF